MECEEHELVQAGLAPARKHPRHDSPRTRASLSPDARRGRGWRCRMGREEVKLASRLTILNSMADPDFERCLAVHRDWGLEWLDLRDGIYGNWVAKVDLPTARIAREAIDRSGLGVFCMSTSVFFEDIEKGEG